MNLPPIEKNLSKLIKDFNQKTFIYDLLLAYNLPKATQPTNTEVPGRNK